MQKLRVMYSYAIPVKVCPLPQLSLLQFLLQCGLTTCLKCAKALSKRQDPPLDCTSNNSVDIYLSLFFSSPYSLPLPSALFLYHNLCLPQGYSLFYSTVYTWRSSRFIHCCSFSKNIFFSLKSTFIGVWSSMEQKLGERNATILSFINVILCILFILYIFTLALFQKKSSKQKLPLETRNKRKV